MKKAFYVLIRFSVLSKFSKGWEISNKSYQQYRDELYAPKRLEAKINFFREVTLPSLDIQIEPQEDNKFVYLVVGKDMPQLYKEEIEDLTRTRSWLKIFYVSEEERNIFSFFDAEANKLSEDIIYATVRLDDDDALSAHYFEKLESHLSDENVGKVISFPNGIAGFWSSELNDYTEFYQYQYPLIALGMAYLQKKGITAYSNVYNLGSHTKVAEKFGVIYDQSENMFIRTFHNSSDSYLKQNKAILNIKKNKIAGYEALSLHYPYIVPYFAKYLGGGNGIYKIPLQGGGTFDVKIEGLEYLNKSSLDNVILVGFNAAISNRAQKAGPFFSGKGIAKNLKIPLMSFSDPLVSDYVLSLGWYLGGSKYMALQHVIASIIDYYTYRIDARSIFLGGSGGGFASLSIATFLSKGVNIITMNPQTDIFDYNIQACDNYLKYAFSEDIKDLELKKKKSLLLRSNIRYYTKINDHAHSEHHIHYVQNIKDNSHFFKHFYNYIKPNFGKTFPENISLVIEDFGDGHIAPSADWIEKYIRSNILAKQNSVEKSSRTLNINMNGICINLYLLSSKVLVCHNQNDLQIDSIKLYIIKNGRIEVVTSLSKKMTVLDYSFDFPVNDYSVNVFLSLDNIKKSKSFKIV